MKAKINFGGQLIDMMITKDLHPMHEKPEGNKLICICIVDDAPDAEVPSTLIWGIFDHDNNCWIVSTSSPVEYSSAEEDGDPYAKGWFYAPTITVEE